MRKYPAMPFEGRFRSSLIKADSDLLACQPDINPNLVRARMVMWPQEDPWPSYRGNALGSPMPSSRGTRFTLSSDRTQTHNVLQSGMFEGRRRRG